MKIAISATGATLEALAEPRFGRCPYFIIADPETLEFSAEENTNVAAAHGAGIATAQAMAEKGVQAVLTGHCGPNAFQVLSAAGIQVITGVSGNVRDVIEDYRAGKYKASPQANVQDHFGLGAKPGAGSGMGRGAGMGRGMGMGRGRGMGGIQAPEPAAGQPGPGQELQELREQSETLAQQLADMRRRIDELEKK